MQGSEEDSGTGTIPSHALAARNTQATRRSAAHLQQLRQLEAHACQRLGTLPQRGGRAAHVAPAAALLLQVSLCTWAAEDTGAQ